MADGRFTRRAAIGGAAAGWAAVTLPVDALAAHKKRKKPKPKKHHPAVSHAPAVRCVDVAIVGAGISGLTAARRLTQQGKSVVVLEARDRVGGRTLNHDLGGGRYAELGGMFTGPTQDRIQALAAEVGVGQYPTYNDGNNVFIGGGGRRETFPSNAPGFGTAPPDPVVAPDITVAITKLDQMATAIDVESPWSTAGAADLDRQTLDGWLRANTSGSAEFLALVSAATEAIFGAEPSELSLLYTLFYIASSGNAQNQGTFERNFDTTGGAQQNRFVGGSQQISLRVAQQLGSSVVLNSPVRSIDQSGPNVIVTSDALTVHAQRVIVAMPPALASRIHYNPLMPSIRDQFTQRAPQGSLMKFEAIYSKPFWRDQGLSGQALSETGPVKATFDTSPADGSVGIMMGFIGGVEARTWMQTAPDQLKAAALAQYAQFFGNDALNPIDTVTVNWTTEEWSRGCPVMVLGPSTLTQFGPSLRAPIDRIHWAGTETADYWCGYMDGAVRAGERAVAEVSPKLGKTPTCAAPAKPKKPKKKKRKRKHRRAGAKRPAAHHAAAAAG